MIFIYEGIELIASFIEMFILYKVHNSLLHKQRANQSEKVDILLALVGAAIIRLCLSLIHISEPTRRSV